jgi:hypothetical protein
MREPLGATKMDKSCRKKKQVLLHKPRGRYPRGLCKCFWVAEQRCEGSPGVVDLVAERRHMEIWHMPALRD